MNIETLHRIYFIGIGGIGMSALARFFKKSGKMVAGYDRTPSDLTSALEAEGMDIHYTDDIALIPAEFMDPSGTLIIYTPAVPKEHKELNYFKENSFEIEKRAKVLGNISAASKSIAVAGTHGKTTTSSMVAHILKSCGVEMAAFLGGITTNYNANFITTENPEWIVAEADEFDRSFLQLDPDIAIITSTDADHLDIYGDAAALTNTYHAFATHVKKGGTLFYNKRSAISAQEGIAYSAWEDTTLTIRNFGVEKGRFEFEVCFEGKDLGHFSLGMPGRHNVENVLAAIGVASIMQLDMDNVRKAVASYQGVKRRFEMVATSGPVYYIDDYAHHPTEIKAFIDGLRDLYPGKKITGIFQPHLYSRTRDFATGFAESLSSLDALILLDIYPARELPIEGVTSSMILEKVQLENKILLSKEALLPYLEEHMEQLEVLATIGAGDIDRFISPIHQLINQFNTAVHE